MSTAPAVTPTRPEPHLRGQTVVVIGGSAGIGLETARARARRGGRGHHHRPRSRSAGRPSGNSARRAPRPSTPPIVGRLEIFFAALPTPIDHVMVTAGGPYYAPVRGDGLRPSAPGAQRASAAAASRSRATPSDEVQAGGYADLHGRNRRPPRGLGLAFIGAVTAALPALIANLALEIAPVRVNLDRRRLRGHAIVRRAAGRSSSKSAATSSAPRCRSAASSGPADVAALAVHIMGNTALTGATYDIDGGQQFV